MSSYKFDPSITELKSTAAECGNAGLAKIRKSVSYMGERRAIMYVETFVSVWNRMKMMKQQVTENEPS